MTRRDELVAFMHARNRFDYDECQHGTYTGGPSHGEPYAMCERQADALILAGFVPEPEYEYGWAGDALADTFYDSRKDAEEFLGNPRQFRRVKAGDWEEVK